MPVPMPVSPTLTPVPPQVAPEESAKKAWADAKKADAEHAGDGYLATCAKEWAKVGRRRRSAEHFPAL